MRNRSIYILSLLLIGRIAINAQDIFMGELTPHQDFSINVDQFEFESSKSTFHVKIGAEDIFLEKKNSINRTDGSIFCNYESKNYFLSIGRNVFGKLFGEFVANDLQFSFREKDRLINFYHVHQSEEPHQECGNQGGNNDIKNEEQVSPKKVHILESKDNHLKSIVDNGSPVRVLVIYSDDVDAAFSNAYGGIQNAINRLITGYNNSLVSHTIEVAAIEQVNINETDGSGSRYSAQEFIDQMIDGSDGVMDFIHDLRDLVDADLIQLVVTDFGDNICGRASQVGNTDSSNAYCTTKYPCMDGSNDHTFTHEFGHLYGARHDPFSDSNNTPYAFGHGYVDIPNGFRTIMALGGSCPSGGCPRINNFSNPAVFNSGNTTGQSGISDNESALEADYNNIVNLENTPINKTVWDSNTVTDDEYFNIKGESTITTDVNEPVTYLSGSEGLFEAGDQIILKPGFNARQGSSFLAKVD